MAKIIGYGCSLKLRWLDKAAELFHKRLSERRFKEALNEYLSGEIENATRLRKTREILTHIWYYNDSEISAMREEAFRLLQKFPEYAPAVHLCLIYTAYPVFADICRYTGKLFQFQDEVTTPMLRQKLFDEWGERGSLESIARRVTLTLKDLGFLTNEKRTRYKAKRIEVNDSDLVNFLLITAMKTEGNEYYSFSALEQFSVLFPFEYHVSREQLIKDKRFSLNAFNTNINVTVKRI